MKQTEYMDFTNDKNDPQSPAGTRLLEGARNLRAVFLVPPKGDINSAPTGDESMIQTPHIFRGGK